MKTPYQLLEVDKQATDNDIKQAYLQKVKLYPPDRDHEKFQQLHTAYEAIKNSGRREQYALFSSPEADFNALLDQAFRAAPAALTSADPFGKLLLASIDGNVFQNLFKTGKTHQT
jgi:DnaJ-class molecular chaperone